MRTKIIIYGAIGLAIVIQALVMTLVIQGQRTKIIKLQYELEQCQDDKNLTKQSNEKYMDEIKRRDRIISKLNKDLQNIKEVSNEEIINNYHTLWNDLL